MTAAWSTDDLILRAKRAAQRPTTDLNFTDAEVLQIADEEMLTFLVPLIRGARESYFLKSYTVAAVAAQSEYRIPSDASAGTIRYCELVDLSGRVTPVAMVEPENRVLYLNGAAPATVPLAVCLSGDQIEMLPAPASANFSLRVWYEQRRSLLVPTSACVQVTSVDSSTSFQTGTPPGSWTTGMLVDFVENKPNFDIISLENVVVSAAVPIVVTDPVTAPKVVGSWICPTGYSCIVPLPDLFHFALASCVAAKMLEETSDFNTAAALRGQVASRIEGLQAAVEPRAAGMAPIILNPNSPTRR